MLLFTVLAFAVVVSAQCTDIQLLVNDKNFTAETFYNPVESNSTVECRCTSKNGQPNWLYSNGTKIRECTEGFDQICTRSENIDGITSLSQLLTGNYNCTLNGTSKSLEIIKLG